MKVSTFIKYIYKNNLLFDPIAFVDNESKQIYWPVIISGTYIYLKECTTEADALDQKCTYEPLTGVQVIEHLSNRANKRLKHIGAIYAIDKEKRGMIKGCHSIEHTTDIPHFNFVLEE